MMTATSARLVTTLAAVACISLAGCTAKADEPKHEKILDQVSRESNAAMQQLRWARVALFDGQPDEAKKFLAEAKNNLTAAEKDAPELTVTVKETAKVGDETVETHETKQTLDYVPIDAWLVLAEDFIPTPDKQGKIKEANEHMKKGNSAKAVARCARRTSRCPPAAC